MDEDEAVRPSYEDDEPDTDDIAWPGHTFDEGPY